MSIIGNPKYAARIEHHLAKYETRALGGDAAAVYRAGRIRLGKCQKGISEVARIS